ncbi:MAG TPA: hypothetical protein VNK96_03050 [Fimbriimonadales bacterium]|nr:hypothetical protein [Fimbriimonadales bacterium]
MRFWLLSPLLAVVLYSCGPTTTPVSQAKQQPVIFYEAKSVADIFPVSEGNAWTYSVEVEQYSQSGVRRGTGEQTNKVVKIRQVQGGKEADIQMLNAKNEPIGVMTIRVTDKGLYQLGVKGGNRSLSPDSPQPICLWPLKTGRTVTWKGKALMPGTPAIGAIVMTVEMKGEYETDTPAGRFRAYRVDVTQKYRYQGTDYQTNQVMWFTPKVGLVKTQERIVSPKGVNVFMMSLKSHTIK